MRGNPISRSYDSPVELLNEHYVYKMSDAQIKKQLEAPVQLAYTSDDPSITWERVPRILYSYLNDGKCFALRCSSFYGISPRSLSHIPYKYQYTILCIRPEITKNYESQKERDDLFLSFSA